MSKKEKEILKIMLVLIRIKNSYKKSYVEGLEIYV